MIVKKSIKGDLDNKRNTFVLLGLVIVLGLVYAGFELFATTDQGQDFGVRDEEPVIVIDDDVLATDKTPPPPPPPVEQQAEQVLKIVNDKEKIDIEFDFGTEFNENEALSEYIPIDIVKDVVEEPPQRFIDEMPEFPGGMEALNQWLTKETVYPEIAKINGISGSAMLEFVVEKDGSVTNVKIVVSAGFNELDKEAIRVVTKLPKWKPGKHNGRTVRAYYQVPIRFMLN